MSTCTSNHSWLRESYNFCPNLGISLRISDSSAIVRLRIKFWNFRRGNCKLLMMLSAGQSLVMWAFASSENMRCFCRAAKNFGALSLKDLKFLFSLDQNPNITNQIPICKWSLWLCRLCTRSRPYLSLVDAFVTVFAVMIQFGAFIVLPVSNKVHSLFVNIGSLPVEKKWVNMIPCWSTKVYKSLMR